MKTKLMTVCALALVAGCAAPPDSIAPSYISEMQYMSYSCKQLAVEQQQLASALSTAADAQRRARSGDIAGVILLGMPTATLSGGNMSSEIARLKGELRALQKAANAKNCNLPFLADPTVKR